MVSPMQYRDLTKLLLAAGFTASLGKGDRRSGRTKAVNCITVTVTRWDGGWELEIDPDNVTQVRTLAKAVGQVRDYLDTLHPEVDHSNWTIQLKPSSDELADRIRKSREAAIAAQQAQERAAKETRAVLAMILAQDITSNDAAALLGISSGRVSQLKKDSRRRAMEKTAS